MHGNQQTDKWMRERANKLKEDVCTLFTDSKDLLGKMNLVDTIQHLGIDHLFENEIDTALKDIHESDFPSSNLHEVALRFRLLRERGFWVSPGIYFSTYLMYGVILFNLSLINTNNNERAKKLDYPP